MAYVALQPVSGPVRGLGTVPTAGRFMVGLGLAAAVIAGVLWMAPRFNKNPPRRKRKAPRRRQARKKHRVISTVTGHTLHSSSSKAAATKWKNRYAVGPTYKVV